MNWEPITNLRAESQETRQAVNKAIDLLIKFEGCRGSIVISINRRTQEVNVHY